MRLFLCRKLREYHSNNATIKSINPSEDCFAKVKMSADDRINEQYRQILGRKNA